MNDKKKKIQNLFVFLILLRKIRRKRERTMTVRLLENLSTHLNGIFFHAFIVRLNVCLIFIFLLNNSILCYFHARISFWWSGLSANIKSNGNGAFWKKSLIKIHTSPSLEMSEFTYFMYFANWNKNCISISRNKCSVHIKTFSVHCQQQIIWMEKNHILLMIHVESLFNGNYGVVFI